MPVSDRSFTILVGVVATIMFGWVLKVGGAIIQPLVIALLLATMLAPVVRGLARWHIPPPATVIALATLLFLVLARLGIFISKSVSQLFGLGGDSELTWRQVVDSIAQRLADSDVPPQLAEFLVDSIEQWDLRNLAAELIGGGFNFSRGLLLVIIYMLFIFAEQAVFRRKILVVAGERQDDAREVLDRIGRGIQRYLGVKTVASVVTGGLCYGALRFLEVPYAPLFGLLTFMLNYIPTFGSIIAAIFPTATALAVNQTVGTAVIVLVFYLAVNTVVGNFLEPKVLGRELNLSPLVIIVSVVVWAGLWGVAGTFLAVPLTATLQIILNSIETTRPIAVMLSSGPPREDKRRMWPSRASRRDSA